MQIDDIRSKSIDNIELYRLTSIFIDETFQWFPCLGIFNVIVVVFIIVRSDSDKNSSLIDNGC